MENLIKLIRAEINLLGVNPIGHDEVAVSYEFPYRSKYGERRWTKQILIEEFNDVGTERSYGNIYNKVQILRKELEQ